MITEEQYIEARNIVEAYNKQLGLYNVTQRNILMTDINGILIRCGHKLKYQGGTEFEATCEVYKKGNEVYIGKWSDDTQEFLVADFWHEDSDRKITEVLNPDYVG